MSIYKVFLGGFCSEIIICISCGCSPLAGKKYCQNCAAETDPSAVVCVKCGVKLATRLSAGNKSKIVAGILGILLGGLGIHRFYLGYIGIGIIQIIVTLVTFGFGAIWGFIEGILILGGTIDKDAQGRPLVD